MRTTSIFLKTKLQLISSLNNVKIFFRKAAQAIPDTVCCVPVLPNLTLYLFLLSIRRLRSAPTPLVFTLPVLSLLPTIRHLLLCLQCVELVPTCIRNPPVPRRDFPHGGTLTHRRQNQWNGLVPLKGQYKLTDDDYTQPRTNQQQAQDQAIQDRVNLRDPRDISAYQQFSRFISDNMTRALNKRNPYNLIYSHTVPNFNVDT